MSVRLIADLIGDKTLFFVLGMPKSGTTWLQKLLDHHPQIACRGEDDFAQLANHVMTMMNSYNSDSVARNAQQDSQRFLTFDEADVAMVVGTLAELMLGRAAIGEDVPCVGSKFPNFSASPDFFDRETPDARYLLILRDPRDILVSGYYFARVRDEERMEAMGGLPGYIAAFLPEFTAGLKRLLTFAEGRGKERTMVLRYCDLHAAPQTTVSAAYRFLGVDDGQAIADAALDCTMFEKLSGGRKPGQEQPDAFYRKGIVGDWRNKLDPATAQMFASGELPALLAQYGYRF